MSKIILIDDDQFYHRIARLMMKAYGSGDEVISSFDGKLIIDFLIENKLNSTVLPDYILVDLHMPGFTGWDFLNDFSKIYKTLKKKIHIYIVSSSVDPSEVRRSKEYPFVESFINKPLTRELIKKIAS